MLRSALVILLLSVASIHAQDRPTPYKCRPLDFEIGLPAGWQAEQDRTGMVASTRDVGFLITREPFLYTEKDFAAVWGEQLKAAKIDAKVKATKVGRWLAYTASWDAEKAGRMIEVWRLHMPVNEMLYNVSFSAKAGTELKPIVEEVLRSFKCTATAPTLKFQPEALDLTASLAIKIPQGYERQEARRRGDPTWTKQLPGYTPAYVAAVMKIKAYNARMILPVPGEKRGVSGGDVKTLTQVQFDLMKKDLGKVLKKPRLKPARFGSIKGFTSVASALTKEGRAKNFHAIGLKLRGATIVVTLLVDARDDRLYRGMGKQIASHFIVKKK